MKKYIVGVPIRGMQFYVVEAKSNAEAKRTVRAGGGKAHSFEITWEGSPSQCCEALWEEAIDTVD